MGVVSYSGWNIGISGACCPEFLPSCLVSGEWVWPALWRWDRPTWKPEGLSAKCYLLAFWKITLHSLIKNLLTLLGRSNSWLQSMGSLRVGHDWAISLSLFTFMHWRRKWKPTPVFLPRESQGRGTWWAAVYGVAQSQTRLKRLSSSMSIIGQ